MSMNKQEYKDALRAARAQFVSERRKRRATERRCRSLLRNTKKERARAARVARREKLKEEKQAKQLHLKAKKSQRAEARAKRREQFRQKKWETAIRKASGVRKGALCSAFCVLRRFCCRIGQRTARMFHALLGVNFRAWVLFVGLCLSVAALFWLFPVSLERLAGAWEDLRGAVVYYFVKMGGGEPTGELSVNTMPQIDLRRVCPFDLDNLLCKLSALPGALCSKEMLTRYFAATGRVLYYISFYGLMFLPLGILGWILFRRYLFAPRTEHGDTKPYRFFQGKLLPPVRRTTRAVRNFLAYADTTPYPTLYLLVWLVNLNLVTVLAEFYAWYFYAAASLSFASVGVNLCRLAVDLLIAFWSAPLIVWILLGFKIFDAWRRRIGYMLLRHHEAKNAGFFSGLAVAVLVVGTMGKGKTQLITDMGLTGQNYFRRKARELILRVDMQFPHFPWQRFEDALGCAVRAGAIHNWADCKYFVRRRRAVYERNPTPHNMWGYCAELHGDTYRDDLGARSLWDALESYARLYYLYALNSSLISANYSVRDDATPVCLGNFPTWNDDFFERAVPEIEEYCHILDFDTLRTGKLVEEDNPFRGSKEFGVDLLSELGKERGNMLENRGLKKQDEQTNPLNDGFDNRVKMHRHGAVVENFCFAKILGDEQRDSSLGANLRELCSIVDIADREDSLLTMPGYALGSLLWGLFFEKFVDLYGTLRYRRGDHSLFLYLFKSVFGVLYRHHMHIVNTFGFSELTLQTASGSGKDLPEKHKYYLAYKKIYARRYKTDCYGELFATQAAASGTGLADYPTYADLQANTDELHSQHSYFMDSIIRQFGADDNQTTATKAPK